MVKTFPVRTYDHPNRYFIDNIRSLIIGAIPNVFPVTI